MKHYNIKEIKNMQPLIQWYCKMLQWQEQYSMKLLRLWEKLKNRTGDKAKNTMNKIHWKLYKRRRREQEWKEEMAEMGWKICCVTKGYIDVLYRSKTKGVLLFCIGPDDKNLYYHLPNENYLKRKVYANRKRQKVSKRSKQ